MYGLMPMLFRMGILPKPPIAASIAPSDTTTSIVIRPDRSDQIECGKTPIRTLKNIVYAAPKRADGKSTSLRMDIFIPEPMHKRTVVVYVPGGGFVMAAKESALNLRTYVAEAGFAVASVEYRTIRDGATYRDGVDDIKAAIRYLRANAATYGIDADAVVVWGESAGGYLAAMVGVTSGNTSFDAGEDLNRSGDVQGVIDDFGASDISKMAADFDAATQHAIYTNQGLIKYIG
jgi:acetyl esterase/lipase